ncbi:FAD-dependent oxidoreductase [Nocardia sp. CDC160]|uniref:FAD-dependent oxidoreductase n=1 Tax=Nocardia sp. CDC160 TaxID=3112166 RepID=UPI002DC022AB|nr:NAD(P)/FAD-dependent oxidoreductase [Nocardia sp. CDC160]MEC3916408.1 NAD(P)/FAD-dependent oxidoreductase [Nocardia sp. CDC160]
MNKSALRVIVIGAGLGGLALAQGLHRDGIDVAVYERDASPTSRAQGYRLRMNPDGLAALEQLLPQHLNRLVSATCSIQPPSAYFDDRLDPIPSTDPGRGDEGGRNVAVNRLTLRQILLGGLGEIVSFGRECTGYETHADGTVTARFRDGSHTTGDVLVAADGVNSPVRQQYLPHARVMDTGVRTIYGRCPLTEAAVAAIPERLFTLYSGVLGPDHRHLGLAPVQYRPPVHRAVAELGGAAVEFTDTEDYMMCLFSAPAELLPLSDDELHSASGEQLRDLVMAQTRDWSPRIGTILEMWDPATVFPLTIRSTVPITPWQTTAVTLLGDAIHAMSPAVGVGANTALRDAALLATQLGKAARGAELIPALRDYETAMLDYGFQAVRTSAEFGRQRMGQAPLPTDAR